MSNIENNKADSIFANEYDPGGFLKIILKNFRFVLIFTIISILVGITTSFILPTKYASYSLLEVIEYEEEGGASSLFGSASSLLTNITGINVASEGDKGLYVVELIRSKNFFDKLIKDNDFKQRLYAVNGYNFQTNTDEYNLSLYNPENGVWNKNPKSIGPTNFDIYEASYIRNLTVSKDIESGFIRLRFKHASPKLALEMTSSIVEKANEFKRLKDEAEALKAINFLQEELLDINRINIKLEISSIISGYLKKLTLSKSKDFYLVEPIEPAFFPERRFEPRRSLVVVIFAFLGAIISVFITLLRAPLRSIKN